MEKEILRQLIGKLIIEAWLGLKYLSDIKAKLAKYQSKIEYSNIIKTDLKCIDGICPWGCIYFSTKNSG